MHQLPVHRSATFHFEYAVVDVAYHARLCRQGDLALRMHIADHLAIQHNIGDANVAFNSAGLTHRQRGCLVARGINLALDLAVNMQTTAEPHVTENFRLTTNQGVYATACLGRATSE